MLTLYLFTNKKRQKNETIIELDSVGNVDTVKRNGYTYSEVLSLNSDKIYYLPDISIKRNDNEKNFYSNELKKLLHYYFDPYKEDAIEHIKRCYQNIGYVHVNEIIMVQTKTRKYLGI